MNANINAAHLPLPTETGEHLSPTEFIERSLKTVREKSVIAELITAAAHYGMPNDRMLIWQVGRYISSAPGDWELTQLAVQALGHIGGEHCREWLQREQNWAASTHASCQARLEHLQSNQKRVPPRLTRKIQHLERFIAKIAGALSQASRHSRASGYYVLGDRLLALLSKNHGLESGYSSARSRRRNKQRRTIEVERQLCNLLDVLDADRDRVLLFRMANEGGSRAVGTKAIEKLDRVLNDEEFTAVVRTTWLNSRLKWYYRNRLQQMLQRRGEHGAALIREAFNGIRKSTVRTQLLPALLQDTKSEDRWPVLLALFRDPGATAKEREAILKQMKEVRSQEATTLFLEVLCDARTPRAQANIAAEGLKKLGSSVLFTLIKAEATARAHKVGHRLALLRRQIQGPIVQQAFPGLARKSATAAALRSTPRPMPSMLIVTPRAAIIPTPRSAPRLSQVPRWSDASIVAARSLVQHSRAQLTRELLGVPPGQGKSRALSYARDALRILPNRHNRSALEISAATDTVAQRITRASDLVQLGLAVAVVAQEERLDLIALN